MTTEQDSEMKVLRLFVDCVFRATECFNAKDLPLWKSTQNGMLCLKGMPMDKLPNKLERRLDRALRKINGILVQYPIKTWDDYQMISETNLQTMRQVISDLTRPCR